MKNNKSALVVCSGGLDSTVALYKAKENYKHVEAVTFSYGANHNKREYRALTCICDKLGVKLTKIDLGFISKNFKSSLLSGADDIPEGHYTAENMKSTVVLFRNGIMLSIAAGFAESNGLDAIVLGNHAGDHTIYPDCRPEFIDGISAAIKNGTWKRIKVVSPFCNKTKADIVKIGAKMGVPFDLTYSCYKGKAKHCGKCGTCVERKEAFGNSHVYDPTNYEE